MHFCVAWGKSAKAALWPSDIAELQDHQVHSSLVDLPYVYRLLPLILFFPFFSSFSEPRDFIIIEKQRSGAKIVKMGPKPRLVRQSKEDLAWEKSDEAFDAWEASLHNKTIYRAIGNFILKH